ncbi:MAG TPA: hypothetical protein VE691_17480 [Rubrobacter sp.]|nr:hypothetical protein [Rubrobacter sp.]
MNKGARADIARQVAVTLGAIFQIAVPIFTGPAVGRVSGENPTLVVPTDYAFVIWTPIFLLALIYAVYQALPSNRESQLLRKIGWFSALAYFSNGIWEIVFPARGFVLSQIVFVGISTGAVVAFVLVQRGAGSGSRFDRWLVAPAFGLLAGWVTAAFFIGFVTVLVATGVLSGGIEEANFGALMLIVGGAVACAVILAGRTGPVQGYLAYGGAVLWALAGVVANQYQNSLITSFTAIVCALLVAAILFIALRRSGVRGGASQPSSPRVV